jgi:hypothetical protein
VRSPVRVFAVLAVVVVLAVVGGFYAWTRSARYAAFPEAAAVAAAAEDVRGWSVFAPDDAPVAGFVFYPGGLVDPDAYAPMLRRIADGGVLVVSVPMPLDLAVLGIGRAGAVIDAFPDVPVWAIGGHSLGGAMAAEFVKGNPEDVDGLAFLAAYPAASTDLSGWSGQALSLLGSADGLSTVEEIEASLARLPPGTELLVLEGGNHAQFGGYGPQAGDGESSVDRAAQEAWAAEALVAFLVALR